MKKILLFAFLLFISLTHSQVLDGGFEAGSGAGYWSESSTNFGFVICDLPSCGDGNGVILPNTGSRYVWLGGAGQGMTMPEIGTIEQTVFVPAGTSASFNMSAFMNSSTGYNPLDSAFLFADGNMIWSATSADTATFQSYSAVSIDISSLADGLQHAFMFVGKQNVDTLIFNVTIDDVYIMVDGQLVELFTETAEMTIDVFPSPAKKDVTFRLPSNVSSAEIVINNMNGQTVLTHQASNNGSSDVSIDVRSFESGIYIYFITVDDTLIHGRFEVTH